MIAFVITLLGVINSIIFNDFNHILLDCVEHEDLLSVVQEVYNGQIELSNGQMFYQKISDVVGTENIVKVSEDVGFTVKDNYTGLNLLYYDEAFFRNETMDGNWPENVNEIVLDEQFLEQKDLAIGDEVSDDNTTYQIVGSANLGQMNGTYLAVVSNKQQEYLLDCEDYINYNATDVLLSSSVSEYVDGIASIGRTSFIDSDDLVFGRMPENVNEIVISSDYLESKDYTIDEDFPVNLRLPNLEDDKYEQKYSSCINLYQYLGKKIHIVGVYEKNVDEGDILVSDDVYKRILDDYIQNFSYNKCYVRLTGNKYETIQKMSCDNIKLEGGDTAFVYFVRDFVKSIKKVLISADVIVLIIMLFTVISTLSFSVKDSTKMIGIYKALGVRTKEIIRAFLIDGGVTYVISILAGNVAILGVIGSINQIMSSRSAEESIRIFQLNHTEVFIGNLVVIILGMLFVYVPIKKAVHREAIQLIEES